MINIVNDPCCCKDIHGFTFESWKDSFNLHNSQDEPIINYLCSLMCLPISIIALLPCLVCVCCKEYQLRNSRRENEKLLKIIDTQPRGPKLTTI